MGLFRTLNEKMGQALDRRAEQERQDRLNEGGSNAADADHIQSRTFTQLLKAALRIREREPHRDNIAVMPESSVSREARVDHALDNVRDMAASRVRRIDLGGLSPQAVMEKITEGDRHSHEIGKKGILDHYNASVQEDKLVLTPRREKAGPNPGVRKERGQLPPESSISWTEQMEIAGRRQAVKRSSSVVHLGARDRPYAPELDLEKVRELIKGIEAGDSVTIRGGNNTGVVPVLHEAGLEVRNGQSWTLPGRSGGEINVSFKGNDMVLSGSGPSQGASAKVRRER